MKSNHEKQSKTIIKTSTYYYFIESACLWCACFFLVDIYSVLANESESGSYSIVFHHIDVKDITEHLVSGAIYSVLLLLSAYLCYVTRTNALDRESSENQGGSHHANHDVFSKKPPANEMWRLKILLVYVVIVILMTIYTLIF